MAGSPRRRRLVGAIGPGSRDSPVPHRDRRPVAAFDLGEQQQVEQGDRRRRPVRVVASANRRARSPSARSGPRRSRFDLLRHAPIVGVPQQAPAVARRYFGTDGVRGIVGDKLTVELVERLGKASALWSGRGRVFVGRDTRASGPSSRRPSRAASSRPAATPCSAGVLPTPAVALLALDLGVVITASHNPPEYNGVKFFDRDGSKLTDGPRRRSRRCSTPPTRRGGGKIDRVEVATDSYLEHVVERFGSDLARPPDRASTARTAPTRDIAPEAFEQLGADVTAIGVDPDGDEHQRRLRRDRPRASPGHGARRSGSTSASPSTATATACSPSTSDGERRRRRPDPRRSSRCTSASTMVAVTVMTNLGFHRSWRSAASGWSRPPSATATCSRRCGARAASSAASSPAT